MGLGSSCGAQRPSQGAERGGGGEVRDVPEGVLWGWARGIGVLGESRGPASGLVADPGLWLCSRLGRRPEEESEEEAGSGTFLREFWGIVPQGLVCWENPVVVPWDSSQSSFGIGVVLQG